LETQPAVAVIIAADGVSLNSNKNNQLILILIKPLIMGNGNHSAKSPELRSQASKASAKNIMIKAARYINDFSVAVTFSTGITQLVNFLPLFEKHLKGDNLKYFSLERFKKFIVKNGSICWGKNEDIIFPASTLFKKLPVGTSNPQILYV
jgi:hypothetical protein